MAKAKQRRLLAKLIREAGIPTKLYRGSRFRALRRLGKWSRSELQLKLENCKRGQVVNDCDYFNHRIKCWLPEHRDEGSRKLNGRMFQQSWRGWGDKVKGYFLDLPQVVFEDDRYSCGCNISPCDPVPREVIEQEYLLFLEESMAESDNEKWIKTDICQARYNALKAGGHICDADGVLLPEFTEHRDEPEGNASAEDA